MIFFPPHIILRVGKQQDLGNEFCQTVGDALNQRTILLAMTRLAEKSWLKVLFADLL